MTGEVEYRVDYVVEQRVSGGEWVEISSGSSGTWGDLDAASHAVLSDLQNYRVGDEP